MWYLLFQAGPDNILSTPHIHVVDLFFRVGPPVNDRRSVNDKVDPFAGSRDVTCVADIATDIGDSRVITSCGFPDVKNTDGGSGKDRSMVKKFPYNGTSQETGSAGH